MQFYYPLVAEFLGRERAMSVQLLYLKRNAVDLGDKINCTVRFVLQLSDSFPCLPWQQDTGQIIWIRT